MIEETLELPCGVKLKNRLAKAAMTEGLADASDNATENHAQLYERWAKGGAGLLITGNVMVDRRFLERAGNVVVDPETDLQSLRDWAAAATQNGCHCWVQISHPGRQCAKSVAKQPLAPSEVGLNLAGLYGRPKAITLAEIRDVINRFAFTAKAVKACGFTGVQIHSAHGYLGSQFLSPRVNKRTDEWGGSLENRARFLLQTVAAVREAVGDDFPVAVKLNSADFSKGGFSNDDSAQVAQWLSDAKIDLLEVSGGTYEQVAFLGDAGEPQAKSESTLKREAFFLEYAELIRDVVNIPLMVTGGFRSRAAMEDALESGAVDVVGIGRPFCVIPDFPNKMLAGKLEVLPRNEGQLTLGSGYLGPGSSSKVMRGLNAQANTAFYYKQIIRLGEGLEPELKPSPWSTLMKHMWHDQMLARKRR